MPATVNPVCSADIDEPFIPGVPNACNYLKRDLASLWIKDGVRRFDVENLRRDQLLFHAAFAGGGHYPESVRTDLGKITFICHLPEEDRSAISVVTGIQGPATGAGDPMELLAHYHVRTPDLTHEQRLACLFDPATKSLELWFDHVSPDDNRTYICLTAYRN